MKLAKSLTVLIGCMLITSGFTNWCAGAPQPAKEPIEVIRSAAERATEILKSCPPNVSPEIKQMRRNEVVKIVYEFVDFREMSLRALGRHWKLQSPEKREEFIPLFEKLLYNTYIDKVDNYTCRDEKTVFDEQRIDGHYALVKGRIVGYKDTDIPVEYRLKLIDGRWKAYDVVIEGVSFISNYRSQFNSILSKGSFDDLLQQIREKVAELEKTVNQ